MLLIICLPLSNQLILVATVVCVSTLYMCFVTSGWLCTKSCTGEQSDYCTQLTHQCHTQTDRVTDLD